jgi:hypothetical protein
MFVIYLYKEAPRAGVLSGLAAGASGACAINAKNWLVFISGELGRGGALLGVSTTSAATSSTRTDGDKGKRPWRKRGDGLGRAFLKAVIIKV